MIPKRTGRRCNGRSCALQGWFDRVRSLRSSCSLGFFSSSWWFASAPDPSSFPLLCSPAFLCSAALFTSGPESNSTTVLLTPASYPLSRVKLHLGQAQSGRPHQLWVFRVKFSTACAELSYIYVPIFLCDNRQPCARLARIYDSSPYSSSTSA